MNRQPAIAALQNKLARLEILRGDQLNGLLKQLESYKSKLPIEDHPIIDWGIGVVKAKMQEEEQFMCNMDQAWQQLRHNIRHEAFKDIDPTTKEGEHELYLAAREKFLKISLLSVKEGRIRDEFEDSVKDVKSCLHGFCVDRKNESAYSRAIANCKLDFGRNKNKKFEPIYKKLLEELDKPLSFRKRFE